MDVSTFRAISILHRTFRTFPVSQRTHILGRFLSCPFLRTLRFVEQGARVLDVGAGHGIFARLAAEAGASFVVALEPDLRKALPSWKCESVAFVGGFDSCIRGEFDLVAMFDVLYRIPTGDRDALFERLSCRVRAGGRILIKELDPERTLKFAWNRTQEWISDRFLRLTLGDAFVYEEAGEVRKRLERAGFTDFESLRIDRGYPHSHVVLTAIRRG